MALQVDQHAVPLSSGAAGETVTVTHRGGATIYYGRTFEVDATDNIGTLTVGQALSFTDVTRWFVAPTGGAAYLDVTRVPPVAAGLGNGSVSGAPALTVFGHSLAGGGGALDPTQAWLAKLASLLGAELTNYAIGGSCVGNDDTVTPGGISMLLQKSRRLRTVAPFYGNGVVIPYWGLNDAGTIGQATSGSLVTQPQALPIFINHMRTAIAVSRSAARYYAGDLSANLSSYITPGTPANWTAVANAGLVNGNNLSATGKTGTNCVTGSVGYIRTSTNGAGGALTVRIPGDYDGSPLYLLSVIDPALTAGTLTASGAATGTFDLAQTVSGTLGTADVVRGSKGLVVWRFTGIAPNSGGTPQTLTITPSGLAGGTWGVAEFGIEASDGIIVPIIGMSKSNPFAGVQAKVTNADVTSWNVALQALVAEFPSSSVRFVDVDPLIGGVGASVSTTLNGATTATSPATGGSLPVASVVGFAPTGVLALSSPGTTEYVTYTGRPAGSFTGIVRGAYASTPQSNSNGAFVGQANAAALDNFALDATHWSDLTHSLAADTVRAAISDLLTDTTKAAARAGLGSRVDLRCMVTTGPNRSQIIKPSTSIPSYTPIFFPQQVYDTAGMHTPSGVPGVFITPYTRITIPVDGIYMVQGLLTWGVGKDASAITTTAGHVTAAIARYDSNNNSLGVQALARDTIANVADYPNGFYYPITNPVFVGELRKGDYVQAEVYQTNIGTPIGVATTLAAGVTDAVGTTFTVASGTGIVNNDYLRVDDETVLVTAGGGTATLTVTRGQRGSAASAHTNGNAIYSGRNVQQGSTLALKYLGRI